MLPFNGEKTLNQEAIYTNLPGVMLISSSPASILIRCFDSKLRCKINYVLVKVSFIIIDTKSGIVQACDSATDLSVINK